MTKKGEMTVVSETGVTTIEEPFLDDPPAPPKPQFETVVRKVSHNLTDEEIAKLARKAADCESVARDYEREHEGLKKDAKDAKESAEAKVAEARELLEQVEKGARMVDVECAVVKDVRSNRKGIFRLDNNECIEVSELTAPERNMLIEDALSPEPSQAELEAMDAWEKDHGRIAATEPDEDLDESEDGQDDAGEDEVEDE